MEWPGIQEAKDILTELWATGTPSQVSEAIDDLFAAAPDCAPICELCDFIKQHGTAAQLEQACDIAERLECVCGACEDTTP